MISSDKAVEPLNLMGLTKDIANFSKRIWQTFER